MPNPFFRFKKFTIYHDQCAMKVGTDGVLLGAWVNPDESYKRILDVGAGSGLISLMLAQRFPKVVVDAVEIDTSASHQANENFKESPFTNISSCICTSYQNYVQDCRIKYDLIVSNPPFFHKSLHSPDKERTVARHTDSLLIEDFISLSNSIINPKGKICFIFPFDQLNYLLKVVKEQQLYFSKIVAVYPTLTSNPKRVLLEIKQEFCEVNTAKLFIEKERHLYSDEFTDLVKDFYLKL